MSLNKGLDIIMTVLSARQPLHATRACLRSRASAFPNPRSLVLSEVEAGFSASLAVGQRSGSGAERSEFNRWRLGTDHNCEFANMPWTNTASLIRLDHRVNVYKTSYLNL